MPRSLPRPSASLSLRLAIDTSRRRRETRDREQSLELVSAYGQTEFSLLLQGEAWTGADGEVGYWRDVLLMQVEVAGPVLAHM